MKPDYLLALEELRRTIQRQEHAKIADDPGKRPTRPKEHVVNSEDIKWKPVDRLAAIVTSRALWIHRAPEIKQEPAKETLKRPIKRPMKHNQERILRDPNPVPEQYLHGVVRGGPGYDEWMRNVALNVLDEIKKNPGDLSALAKSMLDARSALDEALSHIGAAQDEFASKAKMFLNDVRSTRMSATTEVSSMIQPLKDIRQFFLGPDYQEQIRRLKDFVELCERLSALKESGFLDRIADTILRLS